MSNLFQKHKLWVAIAGGFFILVAIIALIRYSQSTTEALKQQFETPVLIQMAFDRHQITNEQRLLYLAYALYEPESLPVQYTSRVEWFGDIAARELDEVVRDPSVVCSMSPNVRREFQKLLRESTSPARKV
jgi:hypothetical protein